MDMKYEICHSQDFCNVEKDKHMFFADSEYLHQHVMVVLMTVLL